jgi:indolepyruvate decarboxylase
VLELLDKTGLPAASMFIGKADFLEQHPQCLGAYQGAGSLSQVSEYVEGADTVIFLGVVLSDFNLGGFTAKLSEDQVVVALDQNVTSSTASYSDVPLTALLNALVEALPSGDVDTAAPLQMFSHKTALPYEPEPDAAMTNKRFYDRMAHFIQSGDIVAADAGCAINSTHLQLPQGATYLASCYWASIGMGFGAALGACFARQPGQRVIALEGDGSFQMTAQELSTMSRYDCPAIVFVVNNKGYTAERLIHDGPFNDIAQWRYHQLPAAFGGTGMEVHTEGDLEEALNQASGHKGPGPMIIEVHVDPWDASEAFTLMSETLRSH